MANQEHKKVLNPKSFVHVVLKTNNYRPMVKFWKAFLGAEAAYENEIISFLRYDEEHHRIGIANVPDSADRVAQACGMDHVAFAFDNLDDLTLAYQQRKELGILPFWCVNHGPTISLYYRDPDGNRVETQVDTMDADAATAFMSSKEFAENPLGVDFDPEDLVQRLKNGESHAAIMKRPVIGPRGRPDILD